ncbi:restriction endonuclease subunit S [Pseudoalteromonas prydzensis]|uniref:restriction endonuclease subunit S n=1 Tax=Pseudoalteromonas prydzensis TaxID=182141 RepID=UPI0007E51A76|nr:restriction endonuclease subunit S [Pseudoalteromonas prydzensis]MBE0378122.1 hypothetical protein [Pseudoalteromonas prydzensis ACAM 620]
MFVERISASLIGSRIDASFYDPIYLEAENSIKKHNHAQLSKVTNFIKKGVFDMPSHLYGDAGIPFLRISDFDGLTVDIENAIKIPLWKHEEEYKTKLIGGDIVISKVGTTGEIAKVPAGCEVNVSQNLIAVSINHEKIDGDYLVAILKSKQLNKAIERHVTTIVQGKLTLDIIRELEIPLFVPLTQKYIGNKVRQAEQLRAWAKRLEVKLAFFENQIPTSKPVIGEAKHSKATLEFLTENRLDARYYAKKHLDLYAQFNNEFESFGSICSGFKYGASIAANYVNSEGLPFIRGNALSPNRINQDDIVYLSKSLKDELKTAYVEEGDILITRSGTVGVTTYVAAEHAKYWYGSFIIKCKLATKSYLPAYVSWYLNSWVGQQQFRRLENGAVQLNINTEELSSIAIWKAPQEFQTEIDKLLIEQISAVNLSKSLTSAAKTLVESLIEGQLTEQQLIQAQQALDDCDNSLDQAILSKLSSEGYAVDGATPLFSDIDELYRLLESAAQAEAEE